MEESTLNSSNEKINELREALATTSGSIITLLADAKRKSDKDFRPIDLAIGGLLLGARKHLKQLPMPILEYMKTISSPSDQLLFLASQLVPFFVKTIPPEEISQYAETLRPSIEKIYAALNEVKNYETQD